MGFLHCKEALNKNVPKNIIYCKKGMFENINLPWFCIFVTPRTLTPPTNIYQSMGEVTKVHNHGNHYHNNLLSAMYLASNKTVPVALYPHFDSNTTRMWSANPSSSGPPLFGTPPHQAAYNLNIMHSITFPSKNSLILPRDGKWSWIHMI